MDTYLAPCKLHCFSQDMFSILKASDRNIEISTLEDDHSQEMYIRLLSPDLLYSNLINYQAPSLRNNQKSLTEIES